MGIYEDTKREAAQIRVQLDAARARGEKPDGQLQRRLHTIDKFNNQWEAAVRVQQAPTLDVKGVSKRMKELQNADKGLTPLERAEFRSRNEAESDALHARVAELNPPPGSSAPAVNPNAAARASARATYATLQKSNPVAASAFARSVGDAALFGDGEEE